MTTRSGMPPYSFWTEQAARWSQCVDFGSPMSAWTPAMHDEYTKALEEGRQPSMSNVRAKQ